MKGLAIFAGGFLLGMVSVDQSLKAMERTLAAVLVRLEPHLQALGEKMEVEVADLRDDEQIRVLRALRRVLSSKTSPELIEIILADLREEIQR